MKERKLDDLITDYEYSNLSVSGERCRFSKVWKAFEEKLNEYGSKQRIEKIHVVIKDTKEILFYEI